MFFPILTDSVEGVRPRVTSEPAVQAALEAGRGGEQGPWMDQLHFCHLRTSMVAGYPAR